MMIYQHFTREVFMMLMQAICIVESGDNAEAIGDNGEAFGCMQIHSCVIQDVNNHYGTKFAHEDAFDKKTSMIIFELYTSMWGDQIIIEEGREPTLEDYAKIWNGGPQGHKKKSTIAYWMKVDIVLQGLINRN